jgi:hypothetical protein
MDFTTLSHSPFEKPWTRQSLLPTWNFSDSRLICEVKRKKKAKRASFGKGTDPLHWRGPSGTGQASPWGHAFRKDSPLSKDIKS